MIERQVISIPFTGGLDTKTDDKLVMPGKLIDLQNGIFTKGGSIIKRNGYSLMTTYLQGGGVISGTGQAICVYNDELINFSGNTLYSYSPTMDRWLNKGTIYSVKTEIDPVYRNNNSQYRPSYAYGVGVECFVYIDGSTNDARVTVIDSVSGTVYQTGTLLKTGCACAKVVYNPTAGFFMIFYDEISTRKIFYRRLGTDQPQSISAEVDLNKTVLSSSWFDVSNDDALSAAILCYVKSATVFTFSSVDFTGADQVAPVDVTVTTAIYSQPYITIDLSGSRKVFLAWIQRTAANVINLKCESFTGNFVPDLGESTVAGYGTFGAAATLPQNVALIYKSATSVSLYIELLGIAVLGYGSFVEIWTLTNAGVFTKTTKIQKVGLASKAFLYGTLTYVGINCSNVSATTQLQNTLFVIDELGNFLSRNLYGQSMGNRDILTAVSLVSTGKFGFATLQANKLVSDNGKTFAAAGVVRFYINFTHPDQFNFRQLGENLHIAGGYLSIYDGVSCVESGFWIYPEYIQTVASTVGSGGINDGTYLVYAVYEWTDNKGQRHQSAPSIGSSITLTGGAGKNSIVVTIPTLSITNKKSPRKNVVLSVYRTTASGVVPYRVSSLTSPTYNDPSLTEVTFTTSTPDSSITTGEILYTTGGIIENIAPPSGNIIDVYKNRIVIVPSENKNSFWYSKQQVNGEGIAFSDSFYQKCDPLGGDITALKFLDDKLIIFKSSYIFVTNGDGPNDLGQQGSIAVPQMITSDVGCSTPTSIVYMPQGIMFKSNKGIYLLDRALQLSYIGAEVEGYNSQDVTSAELINDKNQVRFLTSSGYTLVYDYYFKQWSSFSNHTGIDADIYQGVYYYMRTNGTIYKETPGVYLDNATEIRLSLTTAWIKMANIQGFQRVRRLEMLGKYFSNHTLQMSLYYDYDDSTYSSVSFVATANPYQFRVHVPRQKCESIKITFTDVASGTPGQGYSISDLSMEVGVKKGLNKRSAANSTGS